MSISSCNKFLRKLKIYVTVYVFLCYSQMSAVRSTEHPTTVSQLQMWFTTGNTALPATSARAKSFLAFPYTMISPHYNSDSNTIIWQSITPMKSELVLQMSLRTTLNFPSLGPNQTHFCNLMFIGPCIILIVE